MIDIAHCVIPDQDHAIEDIFRGKVAYARIKEFFESRNALEKRYAFEEDELERALRKCCEMNDIGVEPDGC